jgi:hypothetical protein
LPVWLFAIVAVHAQGTLYTSNLEEPSGGGAAVGSDSWYAAGFFTGNSPQGYLFNSIHLSMEMPLGSPNGLSVSLYEANLDGWFGPGKLLGTLNGPDPSAAGVFVYTAQNVRLSGSASYFVAAAGNNPTASGAFVCSTAATRGHTSQDGWGIHSGYYYSDDGLTWYFTRAVGALQFEIYASPIPEPSVVALGLLGLGFMSTRRRTWRRAS